jgi:diacylglycerol kinase (ATP)
MIGERPPRQGSPTNRNKYGDRHFTKSPQSPRLLIMETEEIDPNIHKNTGIRRVFKALFYSMDGLASSFKHEAAFRQEVILAAILIPVSFLLNVPLAQHLALVLSVILVLVVELLNSALEAIVDDISLSKRPLAKRAKDMGSAAVLLSLFGCGICWASVIALNWNQLFS